jgi:fatty acid desaturase
LNQDTASLKQAAKITAVLPQALLGDAAALSSEARREIQGLSGDRPIRFCFELAFAWLAIAALIALGVYADNLAVTLICIFLISTRQMVLALLLHGQVHRLGLRSKYGDWLVNVLAVYPLFVTSVESYAKAHLSHHKYFFTGGFRFSPLCN